MVDRDKVFRGLMRCKKCNFIFPVSEEAAKAYSECEYTTGVYCRQDVLMRNIEELLTPVPPVFKNNKYYCGSCGIRLQGRRPRYCCKCGTKVQYDG